MKQNARSRKRPIDVMVIGAGQAGLAMGYELQRAGYEHLILDGGTSVGNAWTQRWDSLRLFTPAAFSSLRGLPFPAAPDHLPNKTEVATYLQGYARAYSMPVALDEPVRSVHIGHGGLFHVHSDYACYRARQVVVATGGYQAPRTPALSNLLPTSITQMHSSSYRNATQLPDGPVLVVGAGNSGVQIAQELSATHDVSLAMGSALTRLPERLFGRSIFSWLSSTGAMDVTVDSAIGRRVSRREMLIGETPRRIAKSHGIRLVPRIERVEGSALRAADNSLVEPRAVIWATGFAPRYEWLRLPVLREDGRPEHRRGTTRIPGLYFLGLPWQHTRGSSLLGWVARDAEYLTMQIHGQFGGVRRRAA